MHDALPLLRTKLAPPRPALIEQLHEAADHRLTIMQAGTGYGKTTALASLGVGDAPRQNWSR